MATYRLAGRKANDSLAEGMECVKPASVEDRFQVGKSNEHLDFEAFRIDTLWFSTKPPGAEKKVHIKTKEFSLSHAVAQEVVDQ